MSDERLPLPKAAEELLRELPGVEPDFEALAQKIEARIASTETMAAQPGLFEAPLPDQQNELAMTTSAAPPSVARATAGDLTALARQVAKRGQRSEAKDIARESLSAALAERANSEAIAERVKRADAARVSAEPSPPKVNAVSAAPVVKAEPVVAPPPALAPAAAPGPSRSVGPWFALGGLGLAAAVALFVFAGRERAQTLPAAPPIAAAETTPSAAPPPVAATPSAATARVAVREPETAATAPAVPEAAPSPAPMPPPQKSEPVVVAHAASPAAARSSSKVSAPTAGPHPEPDKVVLEDAPPPPLDTAPKLRPAEGTAAGGLPSKPSTGAVQAALGSVMGSAKACLAGSQAPADVRVTFGSSGAVSAVNVGGAQAGTPAAQCVANALKHAHVAPFSDSSFSLGLQVRP